MKTRNIIACLFLLFATQAVTAQNNAEALVRLMIDQMKSHKNVEMDYKYQINSDGQTTEAQQGKAWLQGEAYKVEMVEQQLISDGKTIWTYLIDDEEVICSAAGQYGFRAYQLNSQDDNWKEKIIEQADRIRKIEHFDDP